MTKRKVECVTIGKQIGKMDSIREVEKQLNKCQKCAYKKDVPKYKNETYLGVRIRYVELYQEQLRRG